MEREVLDLLVELGPFEGVYVGVVDAHLGLVFVVYVVLVVLGGQLEVFPFEHYQIIIRQGI